MCPQRDTPTLLTTKNAQTLQIHPLDPLPKLHPLLNVESNAGDIFLQKFLLYAPLLVSLPHNNKKKLRSPS